MAITGVALRQPVKPLYRCRMRLSETFAVPEKLALLYDFVNTLDLRRYAEHGTVHAGNDAIATPAKLGFWMRGHGLLDADRTISGTEHENALALRAALRALFELSPADRTLKATVGEQLTHAAARFPLAMRMKSGEGLALVPADATPASGLAGVLAELQKLENEGGLDRVKACASDECGWVFFDRSKPGSRRWCSSAGCGNREKTRNYRNRTKMA